MDKKKNYLALKKLAQSLGIELFGVGDIKALKNDFNLSEKILNKIDKAVSLGLRLSPGILSDIENSPTRLYFHHYKTANALLDQLTFRVSNYIQQKGFLTVSIPASQIVDWQKQTAHLSHKKIGVLAGLGWIGRNNLLINKKIGSQFRLSTILTDMPLQIDKPLKEDCGNCSICVKICPAGAIKDRPEDFDHIKCFEKLKEFQKLRFVDQYICGVCVNVCKGKK
ncbi:MAG: hypothetical protein MUC39_00670 [Candidatus Omnitrophica bacterium]|jgi:epoxyqueuosine reductase QueG|nr:hypothetical protein [Candidatus Omnitrophota bacterium]